jgi:hypothetical protein
MPAGSLEPPDVISQLHGVQVQLENALLAERAFEPEGGDRFLDLPKRIAAGGEIEVLGELLGDGAGPAQRIASSPGAAQQRHQVIAVPP